jgi:hypothetical protein
VGVATITRWPPARTPDSPIKRDAAPIARCVACINWSAVPSGIFDAAENTIEWIVEVAGTAVVAIVRAAGAGTVRPAR